MTSVLYLPGLLLLVGFILLAGGWAVASYRRNKLNQALSDELEDLISSTIKNIQESTEEMGTLDGVDLLSQPGMLAAIVTALISKYGDTRLSMKDFVTPDEEYISVYLDESSEEIILSLNAHLDSAPDYSMLKFGSNDDNTFH